MAEPLPYFQGKRNIYVCDLCHGHIVTWDRDAGTTPFMTSCHATDGCAGTMTSSMYRVYDQAMKPDFEWYRPVSTEGMKLHTVEHVRMGGLLLRKFDGANPPVPPDGKPEPSQELKDIRSRQQRRYEDREARKNRS